MLEVVKMGVRELSFIIGRGGHSVCDDGASIFSAPPFYMRGKNRPQSRPIHPKIGPNPGLDPQNKPKSRSGSPNKSKSRPDPPNRPKSRFRTPKIGQNPGLTPQKWPKTVKKWRFVWNARLTFLLTYSG